MADRLRILFTEGASLSARQTLYPLGNDYEIDVLDPNPLCQCRFSSFVRRFIRSPSFTREPTKFLKFVHALARTGNYDVLLPTHEQTYVFSRFRDAFTPHIGLAMPDFNVQQRLQSKADFSRLLIELNLPQPHTTIVRHRDELRQDWQYPFYLKLAHSTAGGGVFHITTPAALEQQANQLVARGLLRGDTDVLVQQPARGTLSTVQAVFDHGRLVGIHCFEARRLGVGGMSTARTSADHAIVREHIERLGRHVAWHGAFFIDYFFDREAGQPEYIEANPRIGETVNAWQSGINLPRLLIEVARGQSPPQAPLGRFGIRTHNLLMILMSLAYDGHGRVAIARELRRFLKRDELYRNGTDDITRPYEDRLSTLPFIWTLTQLLAWPAIARRIVAKTVAGYSLPESMTDEVKSLPLDFLNKT